jgi:hypothetical protein
MPHCTSWPIHAASKYRHKTVKTNELSTTNDDAECALLPQKPTTTYSVKHSRFSLWKGDLDKQRFDRKLRTKSSLSTMASDCATDDLVLPLPLAELSQQKQKTRGKRARRLYQQIRWRALSVYRRLFCVAFCTNLALFGWILSRQQWSDRSWRLQALRAKILTAVSANLLAAIMSRNEHVINSWFRLFVVHVSPRLSLRIRRWCAKVYCYGGIHSGCGIAATVWYLSYVALSAYDMITNGSLSEHLLALALNAVIWLLLTTMIAAAHPRVRTHMHDYFELSHRFCGWLILVVFWIQILTANMADARRQNTQLADTLIRVPTFWMLMAMTILVIYPWIRTRRVSVKIQQLSEHAAQIHFQDGIMQPCRTIRLANRPLLETHAFATIPEPNGARGYSVLVSKAGDWTKKIIQTRPEKLWVKGVPTWGVLRVSTMFEPVVIVATGSGIGPCLGLFNGFPNLRCRILWSVKSPEQTYGKDILDTVIRADPNAKIIDTDLGMRPDMVVETKTLYCESKAEAVVIISNPKLTKLVVHALECDGIPSYGPIWDS